MRGARVHPRAVRVFCSAIRRRLSNGCPDADAGRAPVMDSTFIDLTGDSTEGESPGAMISVPPASARYPAPDPIGGVHHTVSSSEVHVRRGSAAQQEAQQP